MHRRHIHFNFAHHHPSPQTYIVSTKEEAASLSPAAGLPEWVSSSAVVLHKPASGKRCELRVHYAGVHEVRAVEVVSTARIAELYGSAEEAGDVYWQSCRSKAALSPDHPGLWHCPALLSGDTTTPTPRRATGAPLLIKLFSLSPPATQLRLHGIRIHIAAKGAQTAPTPPPPSVSTEDMMALAARFLGGAMSVGGGGGGGGGRAGGGAGGPPMGMMPAAMMPGLGAPKEAAPAVSGGGGGGGGVGMPPMGLVQQYVDGIKQQYDARLAAMEARVQAVEGGVLPQVQALVRQVQELRADVDVLKGERDVREASKAAKAQSSPALRTPSPAATASSATLMQARDERKRQRMSLNLQNRDDIPADVSARRRASSVPPVPGGGPSALYAAKHFFGFSNNKEFKVWLEGAAQEQTPPSSAQTSPMTPEIHGGMRRVVGLTHGFKMKCIFQNTGKWDAPERQTPEARSTYVKNSFSHCFTTTRQYLRNLSCYQTPYEGSAPMLTPPGVRLQSGCNHALSTLNTQHNKGHILRKNYLH